MPPSRRAHGEDALLAPGATGPEVVDLQTRLARLGLLDEEPTGRYGRATAAAVRAFQSLRGLHAGGVLDRPTWDALVEAGYQLGDRLLSRRTPMLRGDDVADLQQRLAELGFDPGRVDGIFGDLTAAALVEFQHNVGSVPDGICGYQTVLELRRLRLHQHPSQLVSAVREELRFRRRSSGLAGRRIAIAQRGGFATAVAALSRSLAAASAVPIALQHPDPSRQAAEANAAEVDCVISLQLDADRADCTTAFYRGFRYESPVSRRLAELVQAALPAALSLDDGGTQGMAIPILRETRMPAIDVRLGAPAVVVQRTAELAQVVKTALELWFGAVEERIPTP